MNYWVITLCLFGLVGLSLYSGFTGNIDRGLLYLILAYVVKKEFMG